MHLSKLMELIKHQRVNCTLCKWGGGRGRQGEYTAYSEETTCRDGGGEGSLCLLWNLAAQGFTLSKPPDISALLFRMGPPDVSALLFRMGPPEALQVQP